MQQQPEFKEILRRELNARRERNSRYSLRAFAALLQADHSTLSQIMRGTRKAPVNSIRRWARKLGIGPEETAVIIAAQHLPDASTFARQEQVRHWTAEAMGVVTEPAHWHLVRLSRTPQFKPDCRWIAEQSGATVDEVNIALSRLLRLRLFKITPSGKWTETTGLKEFTEREFRKVALTRVREEAAKAHVKLRVSARASSTK